MKGENSMIIGAQDAYERGEIVGVIYDVNPGSYPRPRVIRALSEDEIKERAAEMAERLERNKSALSVFFKMEK